MKQKLSAFIASLEEAKNKYGDQFVLLAEVVISEEEKNPSSYITINSIDLPNRIGTLSKKDLGL